MPTIAVELAKGGDVSSITIEGSVMFDGGPKTQVPMNSIFLTPVPITKDNLNVVIDAGWITKDEVCAGVKAGTVAVCG